MPRILADAVEQYIVSLRSTHNLNAHTPETSFYPALANLFNAVGESLTPRVLFVPHPATKVSRKLPDGGLFAIPGRRQSDPLPNQRPERGVVEIKPPADSLVILARSEQVRAYLADFGLCLITNYRQFQLLELQNGEPRVLESYDFAATEAVLWTAPLVGIVRQHAITLADFIARAFTRRVPLEKPKDLAWLLASYAREARARAETHPLAAFAAVKSALQESLGITFEGDKGEHFFLSTLIQTLFYGIFSAWILWRATPEGKAPVATFNWRLSADYLRIPVLRQLFHAVSERGALNTVQIIEVLDHATEALNRVQPAFFQTFNETDAVNYFYEPFLEAFDPDLRKQFGVWYTPREIVRYMVERVDHLLRTELNEPLGLASTNVQVLDPCCGTGAYLVEVLTRIHRTLLEQAGDDTNYVGSDLRRAATTRIFGFEIMPAPFVIAHLQIAMLLANEAINAPLADSQRAQVFLTNALTGWVPSRHPQSNFGFPALIAERDSAEAIKQADTILVILGNPPYNGYAGIAKIEEERDLTTAYRTAIPGLPAPQGQGLNDLYIRFFRIAERRVVGDAHVRGNTQGRGLISFISNNAWLDGLSHVSMRSCYLQEFQSIYIDNLNGDKYRTGKTTPDGKPDPSAFSTPQNREGIQVGTAIATLVRRAPQNGAPNLQLRDLWGTHKLSKLDREANRAEIPSYRFLESAPALGLPLAERLHSVDYVGWPRLTDLFPVSFAGIKTSRDSLLVDIDRDRLLERVSKYTNSSRPDAEIKFLFPDAMGASARFDPIATRRAIEQKGIHQWQILRYAYRPFDVRWLYWEPETKLLDEKREEYIGLTPLPCPTLIAQQRPRAQFGVAQCVQTAACVDLMDRSASCFPLEVLERNRTLLRNDTPHQNVSPLLARQYSGALRDQSHHFFHALATIHTPQYRTENAGALLNDWPRIPLPATAELLTASAKLGRSLATLLDPESDLILSAEWSFLAKLSTPPELPEGTPDRDRHNAARYAITAGWGGAGQGSTVMPRRGDARERDWSDLERDRLSALATTHSVSLDNTLTLLGERCVDVHLNGASFWSGVPLCVWEFTLGGYQVLKKWLSYRELPLLGRPLREDEVRYFAQVVRRIAAMLLMGPALDASYTAIIPTATGLPPA